jgi:cytochrome b561
MKRWLSEALFWAAIGFVGCSFLLGGIGIEKSSGPQAELALQWHKAFGLLSLLATVAAATGFIYSKGGLSAPFRFWTLWFRTPISVLLYVLLILQPLSGCCSLVCKASSLRFLD